MITFVKDHVIFRNELQYRIDRPLPTGIQLENCTTGEFSTLDLSTLLREYTDGILCTATQMVLPHKKIPSSAPPSSPSAEFQKSQAARIDSRRRIDYIVRLSEQCAFVGTKANLIKAIEEVSRARNEERPPHITTVYRWHRGFLIAQKDIRAMFSKIEMRGGKNRSRLAPEVEAIIDEKIEAIFLKQKSSSAEEVHDAVFLSVQKINTMRIEGEWLKMPGLRTIQRRISRLYGFDVAVARYGQTEAERRFGATLVSRRVRKILELVEIDHTPVDLMVVNEDRVVIGRPTITLVIDRYSRCVLGFHLSLSGHGTPAVFEALRHALLPKTYMKDRYPDLNLEWECYGWFERLLMDNGAEFHAFAVVDAMLNLGILSEFAGSREPNDKPFVERLNRTFNYSFIHRLPGTTLSKLHKRIGFKAEDDACITLAELDRMIHAWILGYYHLRPHLGLGRRAPIDVWRESAAAHPPQLKANAKDVDIEFSEVTTSCVQHYGIDLNTHRYASVQLSNLRRMLPSNNNSVDVKWPRHDMGYIHVWDPFEKIYFKVPNVDDGYAGLTLEQAKAAKKILKTNDSYKRVRAEAADVVREMVANAAVDKKLQNRRKGARFENKSSKGLHRPSSAAPPFEPQHNAEPALPHASKDIDGYEFETIGPADGGAHGK